MARVRIALFSPPGMMRRVLHKHLEPGRCSVDDGGYPDRALQDDIATLGSGYVFRVREDSVFDVLAERPVSAKARPMSHINRWCRMVKIENLKGPSRQTNLDRKHPRPYRLTPAGLASLRQSAQRRMPWQWSTGPRTARGKGRSRMNALKHGERSAEQIAVRRELHALLRKLRKCDRKQEIDAEGVTQTQVWMDRIADKLAPVSVILAEGETNRDIAPPKVLASAQQTQPRRDRTNRFARSLSHANFE